LKSEDKRGRHGRSEETKHKKAKIPSKGGSYHAVNSSGVMVKMLEVSKHLKE